MAAYKKWQSERYSIGCKTWEARCPNCHYLVESTEHISSNYRFCPYCGFDMKSNVSDFETFKKIFDLMGMKYKIPADNLIYLSGFEVEESQLIVVKFYEDGRFQEFCPYPNENKE